MAANASRLFDSTGGGGGSKRGCKGRLRNTRTVVELLYEVDYGGLLRDHSMNLRHQIRFRRPHYPDSSNVLLTLFVPNTSASGIEYGVAHAACGDKWQLVEWQDHSCGSCARCKVMMAHHKGHERRPKL